MKNIFFNTRFIDTVFYRRNPDFFPIFAASSILKTVNGKVAIGSAMDLDREQALSASIGEAIERYSLFSPFFCKTLSTNVKKLTKSMFPTYSEEQLSLSNFPYECFSEEKVLNWCEGYSQINKESLWLPASLVFLTEQRENFWSAVSTGAAFHYQLDKAKLNGVYEVIERDAFSIVWETRSITPLIDVCAPWQDISVVRLNEFLKKMDLKLILRDITTDLEIPVVLGVVVDNKNRRPQLAVGASSRLSLKEACKRAAFEAYFTWVWMHDEKKSDKTYERACFECEIPKVMAAHPFLYTFPQQKIFATHLIEESVSGKRESKDDRIGIEQELELVVKKLFEKDFDTIFVDITQNEFAKYNFNVIKTIIPGLVPLSIGKWCRYLAHPRIYSVPEILNWPRYGILKPDNGQPHPFP